MSDKYLTVSHLSTKDIVRIFDKILVSTTYFYKGVPCWQWISHINEENGYGHIHWRGVSTAAHRVLYAWLCSPVPPKESGLEIDHLCRNRWCVNPVHLELVTQQVNGLRGNSPPAINARKEKCPNGHEYSTTKKGWRVCRTCSNTWRREQLANNPALRDQLNEQRRQSRLQRRQDREYVASERKKKRDYRASHPETYVREIEQRRTYRKRRRQEDPEWAEKQRQRVRDWRARQKANQNKEPTEEAS